MPTEGYQREADTTCEANRPYRRCRDCAQRAHALWRETVSLAPIELCQHAPRPDTLPDRASLERV